jgi:hypothetical protein
MMKDAAPNRISLGADGLGEISEAQVEVRASELARTEGRESVTDTDRERARVEMTNLPGEPVAPEAVQPEIEQLVAWDEPADASGHRAQRVSPDDEATIGEQLVQEGVEEAEHDLRVTAVEDPDKTSLGE